MANFTCEVSEKYRSACEHLREYQDTGYCVLHYPFEKDSNEFLTAVRAKVNGHDYDFRGCYFPRGTSNFHVHFTEDAQFTSATFYGDAGFPYCTFEGEADFSNVTFTSDALFFEATFKGKANFDQAKFQRYARFNGREESPTTFELDASFSRATFNEEALFTQADFSQDVDFQFSNFAEKANFRYVMFSGAARFGGATFNKTVAFTLATFIGEANFVEATFTVDAEFVYTIFGAKVYFHRVNSQGSMQFTGNEDNLMFNLDAEVSFIGARIVLPELLVFQTVQLRPSWFHSVDARKWGFYDVRWRGLPDGPKGTFEEELEAIGESTGRSRYALFGKACRTLAINAEQNNEYPMANEFHYWAMETQRQAMPTSSFAPWSVTWWYWALSGYGERPIRAALWLLAMLVGFAVLYCWVGPVRMQENSLIGLLGAAWESVVYSLGVMTRLANEIPKSTSSLVTSLIVIEGVLGPLQIGLCLLALRRKFMR